MYKVLLIIFLFLIFISITTNTNYENFLNKNNTFSIIIPCIPRDIKHLDRLFQSIQEQSYKPYEIILAISEINEKYANDLEIKFKRKYNIPLKVLPTNQKQYAGANRNRGGKVAKGDIFVFMDADDIMYPDKLTITNNIFKKYNPKFFGHGFTTKSFKNQIPQRIYFGEYLYDIAKRKSFNGEINNVSIGFFPSRCAHGHISVPKDVFDSIKYREEEQFRRGQDVFFIRDIIKKYGRKKDTGVVFNKSLTHYYPSDEAIKLEGWQK